MPPGRRRRPGEPMGQNGSIAVAAPASACGYQAPDGFRSPASTMFRDIKTVATVSLEGMSVSVMQGIYDGTAYDWAQSHPAGQPRRYPAPLVQRATEVVLLHRNR